MRLAIWRYTSSMIATAREAAVADVLGRKAGLDAASERVSKTLAAWRLAHWGGLCFSLAPPLSWSPAASFAVARPHVLPLRAVFANANLQAGIALYLARVSKIPLRSSLHDCAMFLVLSQLGNAR